MIGFIGDPLRPFLLSVASSRRAAAGMEDGLLLLTVNTHGDKELEAGRPGHVP
jgi:hypothetical protein